MKCHFSYLYNQSILAKKHLEHYQTGPCICQPQKHSESCREHVHLWRNIELFDFYHNWLHHPLRKHCTRLLETKRNNCVSGCVVCLMICVYQVKSAFGSSELIRAFLFSGLRLSDKEFFCSPLVGMLVHRRATPALKWTVPLHSLGRREAT